MILNLTTLAAVTLEAWSISEECCACEGLVAWDGSSLHSGSSLGPADEAIPLPDCSRLHHVDHDDSKYVCKISAPASHTKLDVVRHDTLAVK